MPHATRLLAILLAALFVGSSLLLPPFARAGEPKRIYLANDCHTDYMWEGTVSEYRAAFLTMLDYYMQQAEDTATNPPDSRGRFNCDGSYWIWEYEQNRSAAEFDRLVGHLQAGTITVPLHTLVQLYGAMPTEAVLRSMYYAGGLERRFGLDIDMVTAIENQTLPAGVASLWAGAGAQYSWKGVCGCATDTPFRPRPREIYHFEGPDGRSVCMKWNTLIGDNRSIGGYAEARFPYAVVPLMDTDPAFTDNWPWPVSAAFGVGWDNLVYTTDDIVQASLDLSRPDLRVIVSNQDDFFEDFLANHGSEIETFSGSFGNEWDLLTASLAEVTAQFRRKVGKLRTAEALATMASLVKPTFMDGREAVREIAFHACGLYYEHDWTANGDVSRAERAQWQRDILQDLSDYVDPLQSEALLALGSMVANPVSAERHAVFNPLSWNRTDFIDLDVVTALPVHVVDVLSGVEVPSQEVDIGGAPRVRILARDVPAVGYRAFEVRSGAGNSFPDAATVNAMTLANSRFSVTMGARGEVTSFFDLDRSREWVDGAFHDLGSGAGTGQIVESGPVSVTLAVDAGGSPNHETRVTLFHPDLDRVEIEGRITENFSATQHYDYEFNISDYVVRHEEIGMIARADHISNGGDYADENARVDYLSFNHFVDLSGATSGITLSNRDCSFFKLGESGFTSLDTSTPEIHALVGGQIDSPNLGIQNQDGDSWFENFFALRPHNEYSALEAMRFSLEHQTPLVATRITGGAEELLDAELYSFLQGVGGDPILWALKTAEEGIGSGGIIARYWNVGHDPAVHLVSLPMELSIGQAFLTTHVETDLGPLSTSMGVASVPMEGRQMQTVRLIPEFLVSTVESGTERDRYRASAILTYPQPVPSGQSVRLRFFLPQAGPASVAVFDVAGRRLAVLADGWQAAGEHEVVWPVDKALPVGVYLARVTSPGATATTKIIVSR